MAWDSVRGRLWEAVGTFIITTLLFRLFRRRSELKAWLVDAGWGLAATACIAFLVFLYQFLVAIPERVDREQKAAITNLTTINLTLTNEVQELRAIHKEEPGVLNDSEFERIKELLAEISKSNKLSVAVNLTSSGSVELTNRLVDLFRVAGHSSDFHQSYGLNLEGLMVKVRLGVDWRILLALGQLDQSIRKPFRLERDVADLEQDVVIFVGY
jgi:hypothetical protein